MGPGAGRQPPDPPDALDEAAGRARSLEDLAGLLRDLRRRHARERRDSTLTYRELAQRTGWSQSAVAEYFAARTLAPTDRFDALLRVLGAAPAELRALADARDRVEEIRRRAGNQRPDASPAHGAGAVPARPFAAPRRLPADTGLFTGRRGELERLLQLARPAAAGNSPGAAVICVIDGMGGVGKTTLAVHAAHRLAGSFPDGQLFVDLCGFARDRPPREAGDALAELLGALGVAPGQIPEQSEPRAALYRERLAGTRTLVVLDDARDEAQVLPLLPAAAGCLVLVTSRRRLKALDDAETAPLDVLPPDEAVALLHRAARADPDTALDARWEQVAGLCGCLPLALVIAGALLRTGGKAWDLQRLLDRLTPRRPEHELAGRDSSGRELSGRDLPGRELSGFADGTRSLTAVFDLSYRALPAGEQALFRRLGLLPGVEVDAYAAAALLDADAATAELLVERLADHSLLTGFSAGRYRLHDLVRAYARALGASLDAEPGRECARDRLLDYYAHVAQRASIPIARRPLPALSGPTPAHAPDVHDAEAARDWLSTEHSTLDAAFADAAARAADRHVVALAAGLAEFLFAEGPWSRALKIHRAAVEAAARLGQPGAHGAALTNLMRAQYLTGDYAAAQDTAAHALRVVRRIGDRLGEANALAESARVRYGIGDYAGAMALQEDALELFRRIGNRLGEANALNDLGHVRHMTGDYPQAADAQERALQIYRRIGSRLGEAAALTDLGNVRYATGQAPQAEDALEQALEIYRQVGSRLGEANVVHYLGQVRYLTGDHLRAAAAQEQALEAFRRIGSRLGEGAALTELGRALNAAGDCAGAVTAQARALEIYRRIGSRVNEAWALNHYAASIAATGDRARALALYRRALAMNRELNKPDDEAAALEGIAEHHLVGHDAAEGAAHLRPALEIYERLGKRADATRVQARLAALAGPDRSPPGPPA